MSFRADHAETEQHGRGPVSPTVIAAQARSGRFLPSPPRPDARNALFLDFDGTLVELAARPDAVVVEDGLRALMARVAAAWPGRVALVSGRSLADLDVMLGRETIDRFALAGSHGVELRAADIALSDLADAAAAVAPAAEELAEVARTHGLVFERKTLGAALHYRLTPALEEVAEAAARAAAMRHGLHLQHGKMMAEVRAAGDKGMAVDRLMATPAFKSAQPYFLGDDVTDEAGFAAADRHGGAGVLVGEPRETAAAYALHDVAAVRAWLDDAAHARVSA